MSFYFLGSAPPSKSLFLRALIVKNYFPDFQIITNNKFKTGEDVFCMETALKKLKANSKTLNCGQGAAVLRFLALICARQKGVFILKGRPSLFKRPLKDLIAILHQLGCSTEICLKKSQIIIESQGFKLLGDALHIKADVSSQFASSVFLNSWNLPFDLFIKIEGAGPSSGYLQMTIKLLKSLGMKIINEDSEYYIPAGQKINKKTISMEPDMSSSFALAGIAAVSGKACITDWPEASLQPDFIFPDILQQMNAPIEYTKSNTLKITHTPELKPITLDIKNYPDLFPVLSALCALAKGESRLIGAPQLAYKESNRIQGTARLLNLITRKTKILKDGLIIQGRTMSQKECKTPLTFDPEEDHRLIFAGAVLKQAGFNLKILNPHFVNKSFPDFWKITKISP